MALSLRITRRPAVRLVAAFVVAGAVTVGATAAQAAPRTSSVTGTIQLASTTSADTWVAASADVPAYGDVVSFETTLTGRVDPKATVYIDLTCTQGSVVVYSNQGAPSALFALTDMGRSSMTWNGGAATCSAWLMSALFSSNKATITKIAATSFAVEAA